MINNQWYAVLYSKEVKTGRLTGVVRLGEKLAFWRNIDDGAVVCIADKCPHRGASISAGKIHAGHPQCPFHGLEFDNTGKCLLIPGNGKNTPVPRNFNTKSYKTTEKAGLIWIFWSTHLSASNADSDFPPVPFFEDIDEKFSFKNWIDPWQCHYSRCIENQLDVLHLPFVHHNTIGAGNRTIVNGPRIRISDNEMNIWVYNDVDDGQKPQKPEETPEPAEKQQHLHFRFPHIWQNWLSDNARIFIAFVPVDEEHSLLYLRFYQNFVTIPILREIVNGAGMFFSKIITHQDRRVVHTQLPKKTELKMNENLLQGDGPIFAYRRRRDELKKSGP